MEENPAKGSEGRRNLSLGPLKQHPPARPSRSIRDYPDLRCARAVGGGAGRFAALRLSSEVMFDGSFEQATILRTGPGGLTRVVTRSSCDRRESILVERYAAELIVLRRWEEFHRKASALVGVCLLGRSSEPGAPGFV